MLELSAEGKRTIAKIDRLAKKSPDLKRVLLKEFGANAKKQVVKEIEDTDSIDTGAMASTVRDEQRPGQVSIKVGGIKPTFLRATSKKTGKPVDPNKANQIVDYARHTNDGTSKIRGRHFLERGVFRAFSDMASVGRRVIDNWLKNI